MARYEVKCIIDTDDEELMPDEIDIGLQSWVEADYTVDNLEVTRIE